MNTDPQHARTDWFIYAQNRMGHLAFRLMLTTFCLTSVLPKSANNNSLVFEKAQQVYNTIWTTQMIATVQSFVNNVVYSIWMSLFVCSYPFHAHGLHIPSTPTAYISLPRPRLTYPFHAHGLHIPSTLTAYISLPRPRLTYPFHAHGLHIPSTPTAYISLPRPRLTYPFHAHGLHIPSTPTAYISLPRPRLTYPFHAHGLPAFFNCQSFSKSDNIVSV